MNLLGISSKKNQASMAAFFDREMARAKQPCEKTRDGTHNWQLREHGVLSGSPVYECHCGAVEVRK